MKGPRLYTPPSGLVVLPVRDFDCHRYPRCLDKAADAYWPSWTCQGCPLCTARHDHHVLGDEGPNDARGDYLESGAVVSWKPVELHDDLDHQCVDCGRVGDAYSVFLVDGLPRCILCRPDLGGPISAYWAARWEPGTKAMSPLIKMKHLAVLAGISPKTAERQVERAQLATYQPHARLRLVPARQLGLEIAWHPPPRQAVQEGSIVALFGLRTARGGLVTNLLQGRDSVPWLELAHLLHDCRTPRPREATCST